MTTNPFFVNYKPYTKNMHTNNQVEEKDWVSKKKAKLGVIFFFIYLIFYAGFVTIGVLNYELLAIEVFSGVNLAICYGIGLILFAILLGILYNYFCTRYEDEGLSLTEINKEAES